MFVYSKHARDWLPKFDAHLQGQAAGPPASAVSLEKLRIATYNVWFDAYEADRRREALFEILSSEDLDVIALEEVTIPFLMALLAEGWVRDAYEITRIDLDPAERYDVVLLSRLPVAQFSAHPLTSSMGRKLHMIELSTECGPLAVGAVHLESMKQMTPTRLTQIEECVPILSAWHSAVWLGDFNAAPGSEEHERMCHAFSDAWSELLESEPGYTRDTTRNAMLAKVKDDRHQRIDRILVRSQCLKPASIRLLGTEPIAGTSEVFPSDHFGVVAELTCSDAHEHCSSAATAE